MKKVCDGQKIEQGEQVHLPDLPVVHIMHQSRKVRCLKDRNIMRYILNVIDGDKHFLTFKVDLILNPCMCLVDVGSTLRLIKFEPVYYHHNKSAEVGLVVLLSNFLVIGKSVDSEDSATRPDPNNWLAICAPVHEI